MLVVAASYTLAFNLLMLIFAYNDDEQQFICCWPLVIHTHLCMYVYLDRVWSEKKLSKVEQSRAVKLWWEQYFSPNQTQHRYTYTPSCPPASPSLLGLMKFSCKLMDKNREHVLVVHAKFNGYLFSALQKAF